MTDWHTSVFHSWKSQLLLSPVTESVRFRDICIELFAVPGFVDHMAEQVVVADWPNSWLVRSLDPVLNERLSGEIAKWLLTTMRDQGVLVLNSGEFEIDEEAFVAFKAKLLDTSVDGN